MDPLTFVGLSIFYAANSIYSGLNVTAQPYSIPFPPALEGPLAPNNILGTNSQRLLSGQIVGPESLIVEGNTIYASLYDGRVVKIQNEVIVKEIRFTTASPCEYPVLPFFLRNGQLAKDGVVVCQMNIEIHRPNEKQMGQFANFFKEIVRERQWTFMSSSTIIGHLRLYMVNNGSDECRRRYFGNSEEENDEEDV